MSAGASVGPRRRRVGSDDDDEHSKSSDSRAAYADTKPAVANSANANANANANSGSVVAGRKRKESTSAGGDDEDEDEDDAMMMDEGDEEMLGDDGDEAAAGAGGARGGINTQKAMLRERGEVHAPSGTTCNDVGAEGERIAVTRHAFFFFFPVLLYTPDVPLNRSLALAIVSSRYPTRPLTLSLAPAHSWPWHFR